MEIRIDISKKKIYVPKQIADEIKNARKKRSDISVLQAFERTQFLDDLDIVTIAEKKREISAEEHDINVMSFEDLKEAMKTKPEEDQKEFAKKLEELERKTKAKGLTKSGKERKINPISLKTWYKKKYFVEPNKKKKNSSEK